MHLIGVSFSRWLRDGSAVENYGDDRWVRVEAADLAGLPFNGDTLLGVLLFVDLPLNTAAGLDLPNDLQPADFLAFELRQAGDFSGHGIAGCCIFTPFSDGGVYQVVGVEFFETELGTATSHRATIFTDFGAVECATPKD